MSLLSSTRWLVASALVAEAVALVPAVGQQPSKPHTWSMPHHSMAARPQEQRPAPVERRPPQPQGQAQMSAQPRQAAPIERRNPSASAAANYKGGHLADWMNQHSNMTPEQQKEALAREPGFRELPGPTQERFQERLSQLNAMPAPQRERLLERNEAMERLTPVQRTEVRQATEQWASLPPDQKHDVARSFRALRKLPPEQRAAALASGRYSAPFSPAERQALNGLMRVEPMLPPDQ